MKNLLLDCCHVSIFHVLAYYLVQAHSLSVFSADSFHICPICNSIYPGNDFFISGGCYLCSILPVYLITIILRRIVGGCDRHTGCASQEANCKGKLRCRAQAVKHISLYTVCCHTEGSFFCKLSGKMPGIIGDHHASLRSAVAHCPLACHTSFGDAT